ncbi:MAG TPA: hypothetical protein VFZ38_05040, partial [Vicinamibacterales bacterium]
MFQLFQGRGSDGFGFGCERRRRSCHRAEVRSRFGGTAAFFFGRGSGSGNRDSCYFGESTLLCGCRLRRSAAFLFRRSLCRSTCFFRPGRFFSATLLFRARGFFGPTLLFGPCGFFSAALFFRPCGFFGSTLFFRPCGFFGPTLL